MKSEEKIGGAENYLEGATRFLLANFRVWLVRSCRAEWR